MPKLHINQTLSQKVPFLLDIDANHGLSMFYKNANHFSVDESGLSDPVFTGEADLECKGEFLLHLMMDSDPM